MAFNILTAVLVVTALTTGFGAQPFQEAVRDAIYSIVRQPFTSELSGDDRGVVKSCGPPDANFSIEWSPKVINPDGDIEVYYDYVIPHDFKSGKVKVTLYFNKSPIFDDTFPVDCSKIGKYVKCPLKKGVRLHGTYKYSNLLFLKGYDGTYSATATLTNQDNQVMICVNATVTIGSGDQLLFKTLDLP